MLYGDGAGSNCAPQEDVVDAQLKQCPLRTQDLKDRRERRWAHDG